MIFFQIAFFVFFIASISFFPFHSLTDKLVAMGLGLASLSFVTFFLVRIIPFFRFLTLSISTLLSLSVIWMLGNVLRVDFSFTADSYWMEIIFTILSYTAVYYALIMGFSSEYFRRILPDKKNANGEKFLVDTSAIIDGRLIDIAKSGFVTKGLLIPQFVIRELQLISDSPNHEKRSKGRRGLDVLKQMKNSDFLTVEMTVEDLPDVIGVDNKLLALAAKKHYRIITTDFNLVKVAQVEGVKVMNINQLSTCLRPSINSGDKVKVFVSKKGNNKNQGVAFLPDDTMIVIDEGEKHIGYQRTVLINSYIQNESGRIAFARIITTAQNSSS